MVYIIFICVLALVKSHRCKELKKVLKYQVGMSSLCHVSTLYTSAVHALHHSPGKSQDFVNYYALMSQLTLSK